MLIGAGTKIKPGVTVAKPLPPVSYSLTSVASNINEGSSLTFNVSTTAVPNGTTLYWGVGIGGTNMSFGRLSSTVGSVTVVNGAASFSITVSADNLTSPEQQYFTVYLYKNAPGGSGGITVDQININVNDTSQTPVSGLFAPASNSSLKIGETYWTLTSTNGFFNGGLIGMTIRLKDASGNYYTTTLYDHSYSGTFNVNKVAGMPQPQTDWLWSNGGSEPIYNIVSVSEPTLPNTPWNLGSSYTIEFWMKHNAPSTSQQGLICQDGWFGNLEGGNRNNAILIGLVGGTLAVGQCNGYDAIYCAEPTPSGIPTSLANWSTGSGGWNQGYYSNLATTGGTGTGLTVDVAANGDGYINISAITIHTTGSGYTDGDVITIANEYNITGTFTITVTPSLWTHVAVVNTAGTTKIYYNGVEQTLTNDSVMRTAAYTNNYMPLYIGRLGGGYGGYFDGKITGIRITDQAQYSSNFTPAIIPEKITGHTKLLWSPDTGAFTTDSGDYGLAIANNSVVSNADFPHNSSLVFDGGSYCQIGTAGTTPWALGTTWTIEWWQKSTNATTVSGLYTVMGQYAGSDMIDIYYQNGYLHAGNNQQICAEPPVGQWVHVAMVTSDGSTKVYYNGVAQSVNALNYNLQNSALALYIGCRGSYLFQNFIGKLTNIRICSTAKYSNDFTPSILPQLDSGNTALMIRPSNYITFSDEGDNNLSITNNGVTFSTDYPH